MLNKLIDLINHELTIQTWDNGEFIETEANVEEVANYLLEHKVVILTADVEKVVRCKNCEHYYDGKCYVANRSPLFKYDVNIHHRKEDDFCSYGKERRSK